MTAKKKRWELDRDLLLADLEKDPRNTRTVFYLAQVTILWMGRMTNSRMIVLVICQMHSNIIVYAMKWVDGLKNSMKHSPEWLD